MFARVAVDRVLRPLPWAIAACLLAFAGSALAEEPVSVGATIIGGPVEPIVIDVDLRDLPQVDPPPPTRRPRRYSQPMNPYPTNGDPDRMVDLQQLSDERGPTRQANPTLLLNFEGLGFAGSPPDTVGDVGPNHYIQMVNATTFAIWDKAGTQVLQPTAMSTLAQMLAPANSPCQVGAGDPIVLYDEMADRWLISEFIDNEMTNPNPANGFCVYISRTADPVTGGWFFYQFLTNLFPDYPKYGVWPNAYTVTSNENDMPTETPAYALDREMMLQGMPARPMQRVVAPSLTGFGFLAMTPADLDGGTTPAGLPPANAPAYFVRHNDDELHSMTPSATQDFIDLFQWNIDFATPANSVFTGPMQIAMSEFDSAICAGVMPGMADTCIQQPGTTQRLDTVNQVAMWRTVYRNFGTHETLLASWTVNAGNDRAGVRWAELRKTGANPFTTFQAGTYAPADTTSRWMGSIAMDRLGNIALGYTAGSATLAPSIRVTGRLVTDPLGVMTIAETTVIDGVGIQTAPPMDPMSPNGNNRWGDYSSMNVDPTDGCTFWYTNEYLPQNDMGGTRIASFRLPTCVPEPSAALAQAAAFATLAFFGARRRRS